MAKQKDDYGVSKAKWATAMQDHFRVVDELRTTGFLMPDPADPNPMGCVYCGLPVMLVYMHDADYKLPDGSFPGLVWGEDVTVVCYCCSYADCPHKGRGSKQQQEMEEDDERASA